MNPEIGSKSCNQVKTKNTLKYTEKSLLIWTCNFFSGLKQNSGGGGGETHTDKSLQPARSSGNCWLSAAFREVSPLNEDFSGVSAACKQNKDSQSALSYPSPQGSRCSHTSGRISRCVFTDYPPSNLYLQGRLTQIEHHISGVNDDDDFDAGFQSSQIGITCQGHQRNLEE